MGKTTKFTTQAFLICIVMAYAVMPVVSRFFSAYLTTYSYLAVVIITVLSLLLIGKQQILGEIFAFVAPIVMLNVLIYVSTSPSLVLWVYTLLLDILSVILGVYLIKHCNYKLIKIFTFFIFLIYAITIITTIIGLNENPDAARYLATVADSGEEDAVKYGWLNIGGFDFVYSVALMYPAIIYGFKHKKIHLVFLIIFAVADFVLIVNSGYTTALLLFIMSTVFIFFKRDLKIKDVFMVSLIALLFIALLFPLISELLNSLADIIDNDTIAERLRDLAGGKEGLENSEDNRLELYRISFNSFIHSPLFGGMFAGASTGGHSQVLDIMAQYGIFGLTALILIYIAIYKAFFKKYESKFGYGYVFWIFMQAVILIVVNPGMWLYELALFIPVILTYIDGKGIKDEGSLDSKLFTE